MASSASETSIVSSSPPALRPAYFDIVMAVGHPDGQFGFEGKLPWGHISEELKHFSRLTRGADDAKVPNVLIMGRATWASLGSKSLPRRLSVVVSKARPELIEGKPDLIVGSLNEALLELQKRTERGEVGRLFLIGGVGLILEALRDHPCCDGVYLTQVRPISGPPLKADRSLIYAHKHILFSGQYMFEATESESMMAVNDEGHSFKLTFRRYLFNRARNHPEAPFLDLLRQILEHGKRRPNRTGIDTLGIWGAQLRFDLTRFPLFTTKRVFWRGVVEELLFFLGGRTQTRVLEAKGVTIWRKNTTRAFLDGRGLFRYEEGEAGPYYAFQWRHFGADYRPNEQLELGQGGFDQIAQVIEDIKAVKADPTREEARRLVVTAWNPSDLKKTCVPPCHYSFQFQVDGDRLNCMANMRSCDCPVGSPFNVASYALLTHMIGHLTGLIPGTLVLSLADAHIYTNVIDAVKEQLSRPPRQWPQLEIVGQHRSIDDFTADSFRLTEYYPHPTLKMEMAV